MVSARVTARPVCFWALLVVAVALLAATTAAMAHPYLNSSEPGCNGSDPNVLLCDDFEDGVWYANNCDQGGPENPANNGWCGTIYANPITPPNAAICGGVGAAGTQCTATHGVATGSVGGRNMADHALLNGQSVNEIYVRFYTRPSVGYRFGAEKVLTFNNTVPGSGGIWFGNWSWNCASAQSSTGRPTMGIQAEGVCQTQNVGNDIALQGNGHWYYIEIHIKLNASRATADGVYELWLNDCGTSGVCTGSPTLRARRTNVQWHGEAGYQPIKVLWWENWANDPSIGERYLDQIKASKVGPIGFVGGAPPIAGVPPASPTNLTIK